MKKQRLKNKLVLVVASFLFVALSYTDVYCQVSKEWETESVFLAPESIVYDSIRNCLYVSNLNDELGFLKKTDTLHNECISKLDMEGNVQQIRWIDGVHNPTGVTIFDDKLYIVEREGLAIVNIEKQKIEKRIPVAGAKFLNDVVVDKDGTIYISDTFTPCIYRIKNGKSELWYSDSLMNSSNGLLIDKNRLCVGNSGAVNLLSISLADKTTKIIANNISDNIDGLKKFNDDFLLSWKSELFIFGRGNKQVLYELDNKNDFLADFEFIRKWKLIIIPQLMSNKVIALRLGD